MKIYIKNMVCKRCIWVVQSELEKLGYQVRQIQLGEAEITKIIGPAEREKLESHFRAFGFELIDDKKSRLIDQIKTAIINSVHHQGEGLKTNLSTYVSSALLQDYSYLSKLFSEVEGTTIEKYFIAQKIEKVKELLVYDELTLSEIAFQLNYSSVAHLSNQFKKVTGLSPSHFKNIGLKKRKPLDEV